MNYRRLGSSGLQSSELSFGSTRAEPLRNELAREGMACAGDAAANFFDSAEVYARGQAKLIVPMLTADRLTQIKAVVDVGAQDFQR